MALSETIYTALSSMTNREVGAWTGSPGVNHVVIVPDYMHHFPADNDDYVSEEYFNLEFYISGDYRAVVSTAKTALKAAGLVIDEERYQGFEPDTKQHHYTLTVIGRA